ncbi:MAG: hypothetical protein CL916_14065 [Deltaproteobacteria bacterium]|nr:hypothetical protein [Deltaproteobacteria bacterium]
MRLNHNQSSLTVDAVLNKTAQRYAKVLRKGDFFSHIHENSTIERTPLDRVLYSGGVQATTAENLAKISVLQLPVEKFQVHVVDHKKSLYRKKNNMSLIPHHTNITAARTLVQSWMDSKVHRENLLFPTMTHIGCGSSIMFLPNKVPMIIAVEILQSQ